MLWGTTRLTPDGALSMPAFGHAYSDDEIAAVANYVTARFGAKGASLTAGDIAKLREQVSQWSTDCSGDDFSARLLTRSGLLRRRAKCARRDVTRNKAMS